MDSNPICHPFPAKKMKCSFLDYVQLLMIRRAGWSTQTPSATPLQPKKWNAHFWIAFNFWWLAGLVNGLKCHPPPLSSYKHEMLVFGLHSTSDDWPRWLMHSNPICHLSPAKKMKCSFLDYIQLLSMDSNPICHLSPAKKMKCLFLDYVQLLMIGQTGWWMRTPSTTHLQPRKWNAHFWVMFNFWWSARLVDGLKPHLPPISSQKHEILVFGLHSTSDDQPGWSMDSNSICNPYPAKKMKCSFLDYIQLLMISWIGQWTRTPSTTPLQPKTWNACFWITFNFWWSARLVNALEPHLPPLSSQKNEMLIFGLHSKADDRPGWSMDLNPIYHLSPAKKMKCSFLDYVQLLTIGWAGWWTQTPSVTPLQPKEWNACFWITFNFWWLARLVNGLEPHLPPLSSHKKWNAHFWITFNFWCSAGLVDGFEPHLPPLCSQKHEMLIFGLHSTSDVQQAWSMDLNPICHPSASKNMKCSFLDYIQLPMIGQAGQWTQTPSATPLQWKNEMLVFGLPSTSDDWLGWSMDLNPIYHLSPAKKMKCSFLDYVQLLMIGRAGRWTWALCATSLQTKKWNAHF